MARLLITGASGLLGLNLALAARERHTVIGVDRCKLTGVPFELVCADLLGQGAVDDILNATRPDWLIHCAAIAVPEACEADPELAWRLNAEFPGELAQACARHSVKMVHMSTDSVFDGTKSGLYTEEDTPNPLNLYARTKVASEHIVMDTNPESIVARVNFYGCSLSGKRSIVEFFVNKLSTGTRCNGFTDVLFNPTFVGQLSDLLLAMLAKGLRGVYHTVSPTVMSKYDFGVAVARRFGWDETLISPESVDRSELTARRAHNLGLSVHKLSTVLDESLPGFSPGLDQFYTQFKQGYPQKIRSYQQ